MASISVNKDVTASTQSPKVTLTNWQRLNNSPIVLPEASAVQWNEYTFVLARDGRALLYHTKHSLWTSLPHCTHPLPNGPPLDMYKGEIITMSINGDVVSFDLSSSAWKEDKALKLTLTPQQGYRAKDIVKATLLSDNDTLHAFINWEQLPYNPDWNRTILGSNHFFHTSQSGWTESNIQNYQSATLVKSDLFMTTDNKMYKTQRNQTSEVEPIVLTAPPLTDSTLHAVKDTLFSFGGRDKDNQPSSDVLRYNPDSDSWESAGYMRSARYNVVVTTVQQDNDLDVFVMGGSFGSSSTKPTNKLVFETKSSGSMPKAKSANPWLWDCSTSIVEKCMVE